MNHPVLIPAMLVALVSVLSAAGVATWWDARLALGVLAGGLWNAASLWCLASLLNAWLGPVPSQRRVIGWLAVKFPLLYVLAFGALKLPSVSLIGFGIGFTVTLVAVMASLWRLAPRMRTGRADGPTHLPGAAEGSPRTAEGMR